MLNNYHFFYIYYMIKKFENFGKQPTRKKFPYTAEQRFEANIEIFVKAMDKLKEIMEENFANKSDEELADELKLLMNPRI